MTAGGVTISLGGSAAERCLKRAEWQGTVFAEQPRRTSLLRLHAEWPLQRITVRVHRNHPFEFVATALPPFLAYSGFEAEVLLSPYDDTLTADVSTSSDADVVWLDHQRYLATMTMPAYVDWLEGRLSRIRAHSRAPILVFDMAADDDRYSAVNAAMASMCERLPDTHLLPISTVARAMGDAFRDHRAEGVSGTSISDAASVRISQWLGLHWLPGIMRPGLKAIVLDLDDTLYSGVLGEDGVLGVSVTEAHQQLQHCLLQQRNSGIYLAVVSRNEQDDVDKLFMERPEMVLRREHLTALRASWRPKPEVISEVAAELRVGVDSILFVDDNPGELAGVASAFPGVSCLHAGDPDSTRRAIRLFPGLWRRRQSETDALRVADLDAHRERGDLRASSKSDEDYLNSLKVELRFHLNASEQRERIAELTRKTNQFNTSLVRMSETDVEEYLTDPDRTVVTVALSDRLADSGVVAAILARRERNTLHVDALAISCRALGRQLESVIVFEAVRRILRTIPCQVVSITAQQGPRNQPALAWLAALGTLRDAPPLGIDIPASRFSDWKPGTFPVVRIWVEPA